MSSPNHSSPFRILLEPCALSTCSLSIVHCSRRLGFRLPLRFKLDNEFRHLRGGYHYSTFGRFQYPRSSSVANGQERPLFHPLVSPTSLSPFPGHFYSMPPSGHFHYNPFRPISYRPSTSAAAASTTTAVVVPPVTNAFSSNSSSLDEGWSSGTCIEVVLKEFELWQKFSKIGTEMIITKSGR